MLYYTIYVKNLHNGTGYIDVGLEDDELLKDYQHFLDVGLQPHKLYALAKMPGSSGTGWFTINLSEVAGMTVTPPQKSILKTAPPKETQ